LLSIKHEATSEFDTFALFVEGAGVAFGWQVQTSPCGIDHLEEEEVRAEGNKRP